MQRKGLLAISAAAMVLSLAACGRADERTAAERDSAATRSEQTARDTARDPGRDTTGRASDSETASARASMNPAGEHAPATAANETRAMGAAGASDTRAMGAAAANDTRAMGAAAADKTRELGSKAGDRIDDATITAKVNAALAKDKELSALRIDVDTQNGVVTLSGPAPTAAAKERASEVAHAVKGVSSVNNQLTLKAG